MKIIIVNRGYAECEVNEHIDLIRVLKAINNLYRLFPKASIYLDQGDGAQYIMPNQETVPFPESNKTM